MLHTVRRLPRSLRSITIGAALLIAGGWALLPLSRALQRAEQAAGLSQPPLPVMSSARDTLAEQLSFFTLGGLRSLAAEILVLDATGAWLERDWPRAERRWEMITTLCPHRPNYWINAARDMATNAAGSAALDSSLTIPEQEALSRRYIARGEEFLLSGAEHNPQSALLYMRLGDLYADLNRRPDFTRAAGAYRRAVELGGSPLYKRQEFYSLCRIRGREQEAWQIGRELFRSPAQRVPSLLCLLFVLQHKIQVPSDEQLGTVALFGSHQAALKQLSRFEHNTLRFPVNGIKAYLDSNRLPQPADAPHGTPPSYAS